MKIDALLNNDKVNFKESLNPGVDEEEINELKEVFDGEIDEQFIELYKFANGENYSEGPKVFFGLEWMPLDEVISEIEFNQGEETNEEDLEFISVTPEGTIKKEYYHDQWIPFAADGFGNFLAIDMDPGENGQKGQVISYGSDLETMHLVSLSLNDFIGFIYKTIEDDNYTLNEENQFTYGNDEIIFFDQLDILELPLKK